jgi:hypothetical protein
LDNKLNERQVILSLAMHEAHRKRDECERLEKTQNELVRVIARNLVAWDTSKDKREGLLPEVYLANKHLYKQLIGEEYFQHKAMKMFQIGDDYY